MFSFSDSANVVKPPYPFRDRMRIFLAGSIEMGTAENWQEKVEKALSTYRVDIFNPRRDDWNSSWGQSISDPHFFNQVTWELDALDAADIILMYFDPNTKSPISLLELGLYAGSKKLIVVCPDGFWRKGNVDVVCQREWIQTYSTIDEAIHEIIHRLGNNENC